MVPDDLKKFTLGKITPDRFVRKGIADQWQNLWVQLERSRRWFTPRLSTRRAINKAEICGRLVQLTQRMV